MTRRKVLISPIEKIEKGRRKCVWLKRQQAERVIAISKATNRPIQDLVELLLEFALDNCEIGEVSE